MQKLSDLIRGAIPASNSSTPTAASSSSAIRQLGNSSLSCPDCGGTGWFRRDLPHTDPGFGKLERCPNEVHQPAYIARLAARAGLVPEDLDIKLSDFREIHRIEREKDEWGNDIKDDKGNVVMSLVSNRAMLDTARAFVKQPFGFVYVWGGPGNAKSDTLIAMVNEINRAAGQVLAVYIKFSSLVEYMREAYANRERQKHDPYADMSYHQRFEQVKAVPVLAIDEFDFDGGKVRETAFASEFRFDFLDERYHLAIRGRAATVFASNSPPETLPEPIYDRIRDGRFQIVHNTAPSSRPTMKRIAA